jgi:hypothetical protein
MTSSLLEQVLTREPCGEQVRGAENYRRRAKGQEAIQAPRLDRPKNRGLFAGIGRRPGATSHDLTGLQEFRLAHVIGFAREVCGIGHGGRQSRRSEVRGPIVEKLETLDGDSYQ